MKNKCSAVFLLLFLLPLILFSAEKKEGCTTAIINGAASLDGVPMLWKNRDTDVLSNKVIYVEEKPYSYVALVNAGETSGRWAYGGLNSEGFGIMNSVAYNLPETDGEMKDLEGLIMSEALRTCRTIDDFEQAIKKNLGSSLGSWANFGVIDANGNSVIFEVYNHGYKKYDAAETPEKYLVNTNFSRSGKEGKGAGYLRFDRATALFKGMPGKVTLEYIFQNIARDFGHPLLKHPTLKELEKTPGNPPLWLYGRDCINRPSTAGSIIIAGKKTGDKDSPATFWVLLGEPVTSIAVPVWVEAKGTPLPLHEGETAPICAEALRIKRIIRPFVNDSQDNYLQVTRLVNKEKTGFLPLLLETEKEIFRETAQFLKTGHTPGEFAAFQDKMAQKALETLKKITV
ncbi:MAG TPA: hypothetical protein VK186_04725 [Candidatus Deferrimicrobium sp.]|nr:hypothetical protein [Candidatus Deferrimicrobium sp.]